MTAQPTVNPAPEVAVSPHIHSVPGLMGTLSILIALFQTVTDIESILAKVLKSFSDEIQEMTDAKMAKLDQDEQAIQKVDPKDNGALQQAIQKYNQDSADWDAKMKPSQTALSSEQTTTTNVSQIESNILKDASPLTQLFPATS